MAETAAGRCFGDGTVLDAPERLGDLLTEYLEAERTRGKQLPNYAGFCRFLGIGTARLDALREERPELHDAICAVLEDEALHSGASASILVPYLRRRLGYSEGGDGAGRRKETTLTAPGEDGEVLRVLFDHDILSDGE